jgi:L,D-peptidoglycan transpeptidase YkuD (ErfK/YbiS/YcfS/YnhG family)
MKPSDLVVTPSGVRFLNRLFACTVGRGGITANKREGDGATPVGTHRIVGMLYRPDRIARAALPDWAVPIRLRDLWSDDPNDSDYNQMVRAPYPYSHETLRRADPLYDLVLITDWNWEDPVPGAGSAIFIHTWRRPCYPTAGCIGFARADLLWIANRLTPQSRLIVR